MPLGNLAFYLRMGGLNARNYCYILLAKNRVLCYVGEMYLPAFQSVLDPPAA